MEAPGYGMNLERRIRRNNHPIKKCTSISFVGMDDTESKDWVSIYGYIKTTKGHMKAVKVWVTDSNGKYEITAPLG